MTMTRTGRTALHVLNCSCRCRWVVR